MYLELFDIVVRGAVTGVTLIFLVVLWVNAAPREAQVSFSLLVISVLCRTWSRLPPGFDVPPDIQTGLQYIGATAMIFFTWAFITLFLDDRRFFWVWIGSAGLVTLGLWSVPLEPMASTITRVYALAHIVALMTAVVLSHKDDLVAKRRRARAGAAICVIGYVLLLALISSPMLEQSTNSRTLIQSIAQFVAYFCFTVWAVTLNGQTWIIAPRQDAVPQNAPDGIKPAQLAVMRQIEAAMRNEIWRQEGLTVSGLARHVAAPEHQVRNAINQVLGHRNFPSFINQARIAAAKAQLSGPESAGTSVQEVAYSVGFSSIGPFNRAFRDATGQSPSDFRNAALAAELVDS